MAMVVMDVRCVMVIMDEGTVDMMMSMLRLFLSVMCMKVMFVIMGMTMFVVDLLVNVKMFVSLGYNEIYSGHHEEKTDP